MSFPVPDLSPVIKSWFDEHSHHLYNSTNSATKASPNVYPHNVLARSNSQRKRETLGAVE